MNLTFSSIKINTSLLSGGPYLSGTLKIQVSDDTVNYYDYYVADVVSPDGNYVIDVLPILAPKFVPNFNGACDFAFNFKIIFINSGVSFTIRTDTFYYSLEDEYVSTPINTYFDSGNPIVVSYWEDPVTVVCDGVSETLSSSRASAKTYNPLNSFSVDGVDYTISEEDMFLYINSHGTWNTYKPSGLMYRSDNFYQEIASSYDTRAYTNYYKINIPYNTRIVPTYQVTTGWLDNPDKFAQDFLESPVIYYLNAENDGVYERCYIDQSSVSYLRNTKDNVLSYTFNVTLSRPIVKY